jgi:hypothetical protein
MWQWKIVKHRLNVLDAIADALAYNEDGSPNHSESDVDICGSMLQKNEWPDRMEVIALDIIADCLDGSTYLATMADAVDNGELTHYTYDKACDAYDDACKKVERFTSTKLRRAYQ